MERYRLLQTKLTNIEHNLSTNQYVLIPKSELFKFRLSEQLETDRLQEKLNDRNKMLEFASELLDHQYIKRDEKISELKTENALLRETLLESQKARDLADRCRLPVVEVSEELPIVFNSRNGNENKQVKLQKSESINPKNLKSKKSLPAENNNNNDSLASGDCSVQNAQIGNSYSAFNKGDTNQEENDDNNNNDPFNSSNSIKKNDDESDQNSKNNNNNNNNPDLNPLEIHNVQNMAQVIQQISNWSSINQNNDNNNNNQNSTILSSETNPLDASTTDTTKGWLENMVEIQISDSNGYLDDSCEMPKDLSVDSTEESEEEERENNNNNIGLEKQAILKIPALPDFDGLPKSPRTVSENNNNNSEEVNLNDTNELLEDNLDALNISTEEVRETEKKDSLIWDVENRYQT